MLKSQTVKKFMEGTPNNYILEISEGTNENVVYRGLLGSMPEKFNHEIVTSYDVVEMTDDTLEIGIMI